MRKDDEMINIGIIGLGYWGPNYVRIFNELEQSKISYCCDIDGAKTDQVKRTNPFIETSKDYKDLLLASDVDAIVVSTPASTHYKIVKDCLSAGKDVLVEKPIALSTKDAEELVNIAKKNKRILMVGHTFVYNPVVQKLKEYIYNGDLGDIYYLYFSRTGLGPIRRDVNAMWDLAPHDISMLLYLLEDMPTEVSAKGQSYLQEGVEDVVFMTLRFPENIMASIHVSWLDPYKVRRATVVGSKRMAVFDDVNKLETLKIFDKGIDKYSEKSYADYGEFQLSIRDGDVHIPKIEMREPLKNQCKHFLECVRERKEPLTNGEEGLNVVRILEDAQKTLNKRRNKQW